MLWSLIFMSAQIDNAAATPNNRRGEPPTPHVTRHVTSSGVAERGRTRLTSADGHTTLGDGHTMPSENAVTRAAPTKAPKLMDTHFNAIRRCYVLLRPGSGFSLACPERSRRATRHWSLVTEFDGHTVPSKNAVTPTSS